MKLHERPLFILTVVWILGVICATLINDAFLWGLASTTAVIIMLCALSFRTNPLRMRIACLCILTASIARTGVYRDIPDNDVSRHADGKNSYVYGVVTSDPEYASDKTRFTIRANKVKTYTGEYSCSGNVSVTLYPPFGSSESKSVSIPFLISYGDQVAIHGRLNPPHEVSNPGQADYAKYLARRRIFSTLSADMNSCRKLEQAPLSAKAPVFRFKHALISRTMKLFTSAQGSLLIGILLGNYSLLPYDVQSNFMRTGTMHLLAASGYNCGILIAIFGWLFRFLTVKKSRMNIALIILIWAFVLIAGAGPSIVRAAIMITLVLMAYLLRRTTDFLNIIFLAILALLVYNPLYLFDVGFQLSFAAVLSIVLIMPLAQRLLPVKQPNAALANRGLIWSIRWIGAVVLVSAVSMLATWPITAYYFNYFSIAAIICNALVAGLVFPITASGILAVAIGPLMPIIGMGHALVMVASFFLNVMLRIVNAAGAWRWAAVSVQSPSLSHILLYYAAVVLVLELAYRVLQSNRRINLDRQKVGGLIVLCGIIIIVGSHFRGGPASTTGGSFTGSPINSKIDLSKQKGRLFVAFLDVGQGDSAFIRTPSGKNVLIDGGGSVNSSNGEVVGQQVVIPSLRRMGVSKLDAVILTHPHTDHLQGLIPVVSTMPVGEVFEPFLRTDDASYLRFLSAIKRKHIKHIKIYSGKTIDFHDGVKGYVLNPPNYPSSYRSEDFNNDSLVIRFAYGHNAFLFMGDTGDSAERRILGSGADVRCNVIKIGHHGSRFSTSEALLDDARPEIAVISVGRRNPFHHPSNNTITKLRKRRIRIYRTDQDGAILMSCDGNGHIEIKTYKPNSQGKHSSPPPNM